MMGAAGSIARAMYFSRAAMAIIGIGDPNFFVLFRIEGIGIFFDDFYPFTNSLNGTMDVCRLILLMSCNDVILIHLSYGWKR